MKNYSILAAALSFAVIISCQKEISENQQIIITPDNKLDSITLYTGYSRSKTSVNGMDIIWSADDKIDMAFLLRTTIAIAVDMVFVNILLGTYWISVMYGKGFAFYFTARLIKNLIQLPVNVILSYYVLEFIRDIRFRIGF